MRFWEFHRLSLENDMNERGSGTKNIKSEMLPCHLHKKGGRNLVVCIDGTAQKLGKKSTNVIEIFKLVMKKAGDNQLCWYTSGMGTYARPRWKSPRHYLSVAYHKIDGVIAWDIERIVQEAYQWLAENYQDGDCIFLFGFSRGAFQVRALSAMIYKVGLVYKGNISQIAYAYEHYARANLSDKHRNTAQQFKDSFSREVQVHFVGAWDTVSSVGAGRGDQALPGTIDGMTHVCFFRHALALDERRVMFQPEYAWGGTSTEPVIGPTWYKPYTTHPPVLEVWFPGTHSDIGRGPTPHKSQGSDVQDPKGSHDNGKEDRSDDTTRGRPPLRWMATHAAELGLRIDDLNLRRDGLKETRPSPFRDSLSVFWYLFEILPLNRLTFARTGRGKGVTTRIPHFGAGRKIHEGQKIHYSITYDSDYVPKARPMDKSSGFWAALCSKDHPYSVQLLERDMFYRAGDAVKDLLAGVKPDCLDLEGIADDDAGFQFFYDEVVDILRMWNMTEPKLEQDKIHQLLRTMLVYFSGRQKKIRLEKWSDIRGWLDSLFGSDTGQNWETARKFERQFSKDLNCLVEFKGHTDWVNAVAISGDGKRVASGSTDGTVRIWDGVKQEDQLLDRKPLEGDVQVVYSIALLPEGTRAFSGSLDAAIRIWDPKGRKQVGDPLLGHKNSVTSLATSPDGTRIISGSVDGSIRIWDAESWKEVRTLPGNKGPVNSVAISRDNRYVVSGHKDGTICTWASEEGSQVMQTKVEVQEVGAQATEVGAQATEAGAQAKESPRGKVDVRVNSATISPDGERIVSGHKDKTIRVWNAKTGEQIGNPLEGHTAMVKTVTISHDGKHIVSGSSDGTVRIWDLEKRIQVCEPLQGHTESVNSVAISPDGGRIVSGSDDKTIRVWDAEEILAWQRIDSNT